MINLLTDKRRNGRQSLILVLEPQEIDHIKRGEPLAVDTSRVNGYDILVCYVPDAKRFQQMVTQEMPLINPQQFERLLRAMQLYPEVHRPPLEDAKKETKQ